MLNANNQDAHIIDLLNHTPPSHPLAPSIPHPYSFPPNSLSTPPPPPLQVAVDSPVDSQSSAESSTSDEDDDEEEEGYNEDSKRVHAELTKKQSQCSHLPRWR